MNLFFFFQEGRNTPTNRQSFKKKKLAQEMTSSIPKIQRLSLMSPSVLGPPRQKPIKHHPIQSKKPVFTKSSSGSSSCMPWSSWKPVPKDWNQEFFFYHADYEFDQISGTHSFFVLEALRERIIRSSWNSMVIIHNVISRVQQMLMRLAWSWSTGLSVLAVQHIVISVLVGNGYISKLLTLLIGS